MVAEPKKENNLTITELIAVDNVTGYKCLSPFLNNAAWYMPLRVSLRRVVSDFFAILGCDAHLE